MAKYMVLFTPASIDVTDEQFKGAFHDMMFAYPESKSGWTFRSAADAHKEAKANEYKPGVDYLVVRVIK